MLSLGIILIVIGAILTFAIDAALENVELTTIGFILMGAGGLALLIGLVQQVSGGRRIRSTREVADDGSTVVEDKRID